MKRSHSRHTTPLDKGAITVASAHANAGYPVIKKTIKKLQKKKARQHDKALSTEQE